MCAYVFQRADWPVGLPKLLQFFLDFLEISGYRINKNITSRHLSTENIFQNLGPHVSTKYSVPRARCSKCNNTILNGSSKIGENFSSGPQFQCFQGHDRFLER